MNIYLKRNWAFKVPNTLPQCVLQFLENKVHLWQLNLLTLMVTGLLIMLSHKLDMKCKDNVSKLVIQFFSDMFKLMFIWVQMLTVKLKTILVRKTKSIVTIIQLWTNLKICGLRKKEEWLLMFQLSSNMPLMYFSSIKLQMLHMIDQFKNFQKLRSKMCLEILRWKSVINHCMDLENFAGF